VEDILEELQDDVESVLLITACDREFEVDVNGELIFSKKLLDRHGNDGEIIKLIKDKM
jgi:predicted Rdx family selenoprotein